MTQIKSSSVTKQNDFPLVPNEGPLYDLIKRANNNATLLPNYFIELYYNDIQTFLALLRNIRSLFTIKKIVKKVQKFELLVERGNKINLFKLNFYINYLARKLKHRNIPKTRIIKVRTLFTEAETELCPEVFVCPSKGSGLFTSLLDSRAMASLINVEMLKLFNLSEKDIIKINDDIVLEVTTGTVSNAILGQVKFPLYLLLKQQTKNGARKFGKTIVNALVTKMPLKNLFLGTPWLKQTKKHMIFGTENNIRSYSYLKCENSVHRCSLALKENTLSIKLLKALKSHESLATFQINNFMLEKSFKLKVENEKSPRLELPEYIIVNNNTV